MKHSLYDIFFNRSFSSTLVFEQGKAINTSLKTLLTNTT